MFRGLETLGRRIGGGSLVTVYESTVNGRHCVVKVVNPNVEYRAGQVCDNLEAIFSSDERLKRGVPLIESIRTWVRKDVSFDAAKYETEFRKQNDGFCVKGNPFKIRVPAVMERSAKYVVEEYAQGLNLTKWDEIAARHDIKQVISLVVKNAAHQLSNGLVHADIHVGNIRVDEEKNIHLLDKNFLLVLSGQDKVFIGSLAFLASDKPALAKAVGDYLCGFEENKKVDNETLVSRLTEILVANGHRDVGSFVSDCVAVVTEHKGSIPLNVMLLVKNALALERMAMRAGFGNLIDAFLFDAQKP